MGTKKKNDPIEDITEATAIPETSEMETSLEVINGKEIDWQDKYDRLFAEFQNYRNRTEKEKSSLVDLGCQHAVENVLPVLDNLKRALENIDDMEEPLAKGVKMTYDILKEDLSKMEVTEIHALGKPFDPNFHHAISVEKQDNVEAGMVLKVLQEGFLYKNKVLRYSLVIVSE